MKLGIGLLTCLLLVTAALAASKCGKKSHKSKLGRQANFRTVAGQKAKCKYRIRTVPGLHIKLTLDNYHPDPCCLKVTISPRQKTRGRRAESVAIPAGPRATLIVNASEVEVFVKTSSSARAVDVSHEAVIPEDGNFGYNFRATRRPKIIRSPNFPKIRLPRGVRSVWNVTAARGERIRIDFTGFSMFGDDDYVEVFDGENFLAPTITGRKKKKDLPITKRASSGYMVIVFETHSSSSKGFKAKVFIENADTESSARQCHKRMRVISDGTTGMDEHSKMTCDDGEICGRMIMQGTSVAGPTTAEVMHCIPPSLCTGKCGKLSLMGDRDNRMTVHSCNLTCCDADMCNRSPDGPDVPPGSTPGSSTRLPPVRTGRLRCNEESEISRGSGIGEGSASSGSVCPSNSVCALFVFSGVSTDPAQEKVVGYVAKCTAEAACNEAGCSDLRETNDVNIGSCNVSCCKTNFCNDHREVTVPTLPPPEPVSYSCYDIQRLQIGSTTRIDVQRYSSCSNPEDSCLRVDAYVTDSEGSSGVAAFGKCIAKSSCANLDCESLLGLENSITATSCVAQCCSNDLCNERPLAIAVPTGTPGLWCHSKSVTVQEGAIAMSPDSQQNVLCNEGDVCAVFKFYGTSTSSHQIGEPMAGYAAKCHPASTCNANACRTLAVADDIAVSSCEPTCCRTNMCNDPGEPPMPSPRTPTEPTSGGATRCYNILQARIGRTYAMNQVSNVTCGSDSSCLRIEATTATSGRRGSVVYGGCVPKLACRATNCDTVTKYVPGAVTLRDCNVDCCDTDFCNGANSPPNPVPPSLTPPATPATGNVRECYNILQSSLGGTYVLNQKSRMTCGGEDFACVRVDAVARQSGLDAAISISYGSCYPKIACSALTCDRIVSQAMPGTTIRQCKSECCYNELCNEEPLSADVVSTTPSTGDAEVSSTLPASAGGLGYVNECYNILQSSLGDTYVLNQKSRMTCGGESSVCVRVDAKARRSGIANTITVSYGTCYPKIACSALNCDSVVSNALTPGMSIVGCQATCCDTELCNEQPISATGEDLTPTPSLPASSGSPGYVRECYNILKSSFGQTTAINQKSKMSCGGEDSVCVRVDAEARQRGLDSTITVSYGTCYPKIACSALTCESIVSGALTPGMTIQDCQAACCNTELCNEGPLSGTDVYVPPSLPSVASSDGSPVTNRCYDKMEVKLYATVMPGAKNNEMQCPPNSQCIKLYSVASNPSYPRITLRTTYGSCVPKIACSRMDCSLLPKVLKGFKTKSCDVSCCDGDLCNN